MTSNQIAYWNLQETQRSNKVKEAETERSNRAREVETRRHNINQEAIGYTKNSVDTIKAIGDIIPF